MSTGHLVRPDGTINTGAKHTPGPWRVNKKVNTSVEQATAQQGMVLICQCEDPDGARLNKEDAANARLIAAAPELLEELQHISERIGTVRPDDAFCQALKDIADKVILKATQP